MAPASSAPSAIAIVGMGARLPGARDLAEFWANLRDGVESIRRLSDQELLAAGAHPEVLRDPHYVKAASVLDGIDLFDAPFFGFSPKDAAIMDPQHRVFLECAWEALENSGWCADQFPGSIGVFAGSGMNAYLMFHLLPNQELMSGAGLFLLKQTGNDKDVLATRVSYQLNLTGPSMTVQTACSTSLVAVHVACQSLLNRECDMALAGGVTIEIPHKHGYLYREGEILSRDGHCRAFDAESSGTVFGSGAGVVVLRRLADALADGDRIHAVILGSAINNDGARKVGYLAPSVDGQAEVVAEALAVADVPADTISYIETHGTGTPVGDPIEIAALTQAFRESTEARGFCAIGSLKTNIGHLDAAAGVAGLIKTVLSLENKQLPPSLHFNRPNPRIDLANSPFYVNNRLAEWKSGEVPRRAGVTSLGIGGTNAHVVVEQAPALAASGPSRPWQVLTLSAKTASALDTAAGNLADHLAEHPELILADAAFTGHVGRKAFAHRRAVVCRTREEAVEALRNSAAKQSFHGHEASRAGVAFLFPGQGAQYAGMARGLHENEDVFRSEVDRCAELLRPHLGLDLREPLFAAGNAGANAQLTETRLAQPALFTIEYALARLWMSWGIRPAAMIGHSLGEFVAGCLAGVLSLEDAIQAVAARGRLMQSAAPGAMLAVELAEIEARALASGDVSLAAVNGAKQCVLSGSAVAIESLEKQLAANGVLTQRLQTSHAFHSASMEPILEEFTAVMRACQLSAPKIPYVSNVTGTWITAEEATDPAYWARHLRQPVRFADGLATVFQQAPAAMLELGPGHVLSGLASRHPAKTETVRIVSSMRSALERGEDAQCLVAALAQLWVAGVKVDWAAFHSREQRQRVELPTYPFERQRYWIDAPKPPNTPITNEPAALSFYNPVWKRTALSATPGAHATWLILLDALGVGASISKHLERAGHAVVTLTPGDRFAKTGKHGYTLDPASRADYDRLLDALLAAGHVPDRILHLWSLVSPGIAPTALENLEAAQALSFYSQLYLAQAIGAHDLTSPISLAVVSNGLQSVAGEAIEHPERALLLGPCKVIPKEFASIHTRSIDLDLAAATALERAANQVLAECAQDFQHTELVAYRGEDRWVESLEPASMDRTGPRLRQHGVYLITGGTGGIGLEVAEHLARTVQAKLVLVSRTGQPRRPDAIQRLRQLGAEVEIVPADVTDLAAMRAAVSRSLEKFGSVDGVLHAAGVLDDGLIQLKQKEAADRVLAPKVTGTLVLEQALAGVPLDFLVLFSSVSCYSAPVGQVDYVAANAFLDVFAASRHGHAKPWTVAINWGRWGETGMAAARVAVGAHPLLGLRSTPTPDTLVYHTELSFQGHWLLNEHCLRGGDALFPGTGYIELVRAALGERVDASALEFERLSFNAPLRVERGGRRSVELRMTREGEAYHFTVTAGDPPATPCGTGTVRALGSITPPAIDVATLIERADGRQVTFGPHEQNAKQARHIEFGPRWRCLRQMHLGTNEAVSSLELPEEFVADLEAYHLHPALLDAATGSAMLTIPGYGETDALYVPVSYRSIRVFGDLPRRICCHIRWPQSNHAEKEVATFDCTIADERGAVIAEIQDFTLRRLSGTAMLAGDAAAHALPAATIASAAGIAALDAILAGPPVARILAVPAGLSLDEPRPVTPIIRSSLLPVSSNGVPRDAVEQTLARWWQELLGVSHVSIHQDFFELGGHSLIAVRLLTRIEKEFQQTVPLHAFFENANIAALGEYLRSAKPDRVPTVVPLNDKGSGPAIFCLHTMGGDLAAFRHLVRALGPGQNFYGIQAHPEQVPADFTNSIERIAAYYVSELVAFQPEGPYILAGASLGSAVALEMAQQLNASGHKVDLLISIDGSPQNTGYETSRWNPRYYWSLVRNVPLWITDDLLDHFSWSEFGPRVWRRGVATVKRAGSALLGRHQGAVYELEGFMNLSTRSDKQVEFMRKLYTTFKSYVAKPYHGRVLLYQSRAEPLTHLFEVDRVWRGIASDVEVVRVPGNHTSLIQPPHVERLAADLKRRLAILRESHKTEELTRQHV